MSTESNLQHPPGEELTALINGHHEWLLIRNSGQSFALTQNEIEVETSPHKTLFSFLDERGYQTWRVAELQTKDDEIVLRLARNFDKEQAKIRLVPRALAQTLGIAVEMARLEKVERIAAVIKGQYPRIKIIRAELNKENGRFAQIVFAGADQRHIAVLADVTETLTPELLLSTAVLQLSKLEQRRRNPIDIIWILGEKKQAGQLQKLRALLRPGWQRKISIRELAPKTADELAAPDSFGETIIRELPVLSIPALWRGSRKGPPPAPAYEMSETAQKIIGLSPENIDAIFSKNGETLRFNGLPFARIRKIADREKIWFGVEKIKRFLSETNMGELGELIDNLHTFRRASTPNKRHEYYSLAPEAWLESVLRRNIRLLDANLILSPVYHQFRVDRDKIDLLALRRDGRVVIIEIKTAPDREMIYQAADYWRKLERARRLGHLKQAALFAAPEIADKPVIVYLVAPTLSFHPQFDLLAATISDEIEIHRFNLAENWRENLKILERRKVNDP